MSRPARLAIGIVSAGRVGTVLGAALRTAGHTITAVSGVSAASLERAEQLLPGVPVEPPDRTAAPADLVLLAIPDDALAGTVRGLVAAGALRTGQIVAHTSGAHGIEVLRPAEELGALTLALHPVLTFTGRAEDIERLTSCCFGVTARDGDEGAWHVAEALVMEMGAEPVRIPETARALYHAALTHGANHLMTLVAEATELLRSASAEVPQRLLAPLLSASLDNALRFGDRALTGPVARGDAETVRAHLRELDEHAPASVAAYRELAKRTATRAKGAGLLGATGEQDILDALEGRS
ncbi:Rossmann-like and DUF2520 domain-containing protein [Sciscionella marina]|uniref:Rossmann-like and DUF2520 domain-containing protein n=1 Tax=Sciscionella marina TaxID=508770 RepID=UPI00036023D5|nr:DUF2520 domain-containing protein [Sciscionella marina]